MDWTQVAGAAVTLLAPFLPYLATAGAKAAEKVGTLVGEAGWQKAQELYSLVQRKFAGDPYAEQTLARAAAVPDDSGRQAALATVIKDKALEDDVFGRQLASLTQTAMQNQGVVTFLIEVYGDGKVGKIQNFGNIVSIDEFKA